MGKKVLPTEGAIDLVAKVFSAVESIKTTDDPQNTVNRFYIENGIKKKDQFDILKYPKIDFHLKEAELKVLFDNNIIDQKTLKIKSISNKDLVNPLTKLLYSIVWKNGDLGKESHILNGIRNGLQGKSGQVFYQLGKHLDNKNQEPIIDQHVIRAFKIYRAIEKKASKEEIIRLRSAELSTKEHFDDYKEWLNRSKFIQDNTSNNLLYYVDQLLFAVGKTIKLGKKTGESQN